MLSSNVTNRKSIQCLSLLWLTATATITFAAPVAPPCDLRVGENARNPLGYYDVTLRFSWKLPADAGVLRQTAYRVVVATSQELLPSSTDVWDSGKVTSDKSVYVRYLGPALASRQKVCWAVMYWDQSGRPSAWSTPAKIEMGLLENSDWSADWISFQPGLATGAKRLRIVEARYGILEGGQSIDVTGRLRRQVLDNGALYTVVTNELAGSDPAENRRKQLHVKYTVDGEHRSITVDEGQVLSLPDANANPYREPVVYLRREFTVAKPVAQARLYVTARGLYQMHLNSRRVGCDTLVPGWTPYHDRVETLTYDVANQVTPGTNVLGAVLARGWYAGRIGWPRLKDLLSRTPQLLAQLEILYVDGTRDTITTDDGWRATDQGPIRDSGLYDGENYDATMELRGWLTPGYDDTAWSPVSAEPVTDMPRLVPKRFPPVRHMETLQTQAITEPAPGRYVFDLGQNMVGRARIHVPLAQGDRITIRFAEMLNPDGSLYTENYRTAKSTDSYVAAETGMIDWQPTFTFHGFRYVELSGFSQSVTPSKDWVTGIVLRTALAPIGSFTSSHEKLNQLQSNITWGQRGNFLEVPTDCPQRDERLGWTGDAEVFCATSMFNFNTHAFWSSWLESVRSEQRRDGSIPVVIPNVIGRGSSPGWGDAAIVVPWELYVRTGDRRVLADNYEMMRRWVDWYRTGSVDNISSATGYGDWLQPYPVLKSSPMTGDTPQNLIATAYYGYGADVVAQAAELLGNEQDADEYRALARDVRQAFCQRFFDADGRLRNAPETQTGYLLALGFGLLPDELATKADSHLAALVREADDHLRTGFLGTPLLCPVLDQSGQASLAYTVLFQETYPSWFYSINQGATTMWERWNSYSRADGFGPAGMNSFNHYAYGAIGRWMYERIGGLAPDPAQPGYKHILIQPAPGGPLTSASASLETPYGRAESAWHLDGDKLSMRAVVPPNTTATVVFPSGRPDEITLDGRPLVENTAAAAVAPRPDGKAAVDVPAGTYQFTAPGP